VKKKVTSVYQVRRICYGLRIKDEVRLAAAPRHDEQRRERRSSTNQANIYCCWFMGVNPIRGADEVSKWIQESLIHHQQREGN
jgi:hypothetical protein